MGESVLHVSQSQIRERDEENEGKGGKDRKKGNKRKGDKDRDIGTGGIAHVSQLRVPGGQ